MRNTYLLFFVFSGGDTLLFALTNIHEQRKVNPHPIYVRRLRIRCEPQEATQKRRMVNTTVIPGLSAVDGCAFVALAFLDPVLPS